MGYSFIKRLHRDAWSKRPAFPDESQRPILVHHKTVRWHLAFAPVQPVGGSEDTAAAAWVPIGEVLSRLEFDEEKRAFEVLRASKEMAGLQRAPLGSDASGGAPAAAAPQQEEKDSVGERPRKKRRAEKAKEEDHDEEEEHNEEEEGESAAVRELETS